MSRHPYRPKVTFSEKIRFYHEYVQKVRRTGHRPMGLLQFLLRPISL